MGSSVHRLRQLHLFQGPSSGEFGLLPSSGHLGPLRQMSTAAQPSRLFSTVRTEGTVSVQVDPRSLRAPISPAVGLFPMLQKDLLRVPWRTVLHNVRIRPRRMPPTSAQAHRLGDERSAGGEASFLSALGGAARGIRRPCYPPKSFRAPSGQPSPAQATGARQLPPWPSTPNVVSGCPRRAVLKRYERPQTKLAAADEFLPKPSPAAALPPLLITTTSPEAVANVRFRILVDERRVSPGRMVVEVNRGGPGLPDRGQSEIETPDLRPAAWRSKNSSQVPRPPPQADNQIQTILFHADAPN